MRPVDAVRQGCAKDVDILVGSAEDEWRHYTVPGGAIAEIGPDAAERLVRSARLAPDLAEQYRKAGRGETPGELFTALQGDFIFRMPANKVLESQTDAGGRPGPIPSAGKAREGQIRGGTRRGAQLRCALCIQDCGGFKAQPRRQSSSGAGRSHACGLGEFRKERHPRLDAL